MQPEAKNKGCHRDPDIFPCSVAKIEVRDREIQTCWNACAFSEMGTGLRMADGLLGDKRHQL